MRKVNIHLKTLLRNIFCMLFSENKQGCQKHGRDGSPAIKLKDKVSHGERIVDSKSH